MVRTIYSTAEYLFPFVIFLSTLLSPGYCTPTWPTGQPMSNNITLSPSTPSPTMIPATPFLTTAPTISTGQSNDVQLIKRQRKFGSFSRIPKNRNTERDLIAKKIRLLPKDKLNRYKMEAARQLQASLARTFQMLSTTSEKIPENVRTAARRALGATQAGNYNPAIERHLPSILLQGSQQQGQPAKQLQVILSTLFPHIPSGSQGSFQGLLGFVSANLSNVNTLLTRVLGTVPDLLSGVIRSLTTNLGAVTGAINGSVASLGVLLGGVIG